MTFARLSIHCQPEVMMGRSALRPANMHGGEDRLAFLDGLLRFLELGLQDARSPFFGDADRARQWLSRIPMAESFVDIETQDGRPVVVEREGARETLAFVEDSLAICILDGRRRGPTASLYPTGRATADYARLLSLLTHGTEVGALATLGRSLRVDADELLRGLREDAAIDELDELVPRTAPQFSGAEGDRLTWIGHAGFVLQTDATTLWVDPWLWPKMEWRPHEHDTLFSPDFADSVLFDSYGPAVTNLCLPEMPRPDAVLITHQDIDHIRMGVLLSVPPDVPIIVPAAPGSRPWEVPLKEVIHRVLGPGRVVVEIAHGERTRVGQATISAFPFHGEFPVPLPHSWNCYVVETRRSAIIVTSDSKMQDDDVDLIASLLERPDVPLTLLAQPPREREIDPGYRDAMYELHNSSRLWPWYTPMSAMFTPTPKSCLTWDVVAALAKRVNLAHYFPCAAGSCPWFRMPMDEPFFAPVSQLSRRDIADVKTRLSEVTRTTTLFPGKYGLPWRLA